MACPNCGRMSGDQHDTQVFCDECLPVQRQLRSVNSSINHLQEKQVKWGKELSADEEARLNQLRSEKEEIKRELEQIREEANAE